jgi:predicted nucleic acid-binding protein
LAKTENGEAASRIQPAYFDSALIAKFYLNEPGRDVIRQIAAKAGLVITSGIAAVEISAAFHRKYREGAIDRSVFDALNGQFDHDLSAGLWRWIGPTEELLEQVRRLYRRLAGSVYLRSLDALHLVTAKAERFERIYSNDRHLLRACASLDIEGVNPLAPQQSKGHEGTRSTPRKRRRK